MFLTSSDGQKIYCEERGNPSSQRTIVFLNGLTQSTLAWHLMIPYFKKDYRIILMDFIFQGQSDKEGEWRNFDKHAQDVKTVLDQLGIEKTVVCGISYGSLVAQHFALLYPGATNRLVLMSTFAHKTPYYEAIELSWWRALEQGGYNLLLDIMLPSVLSEEYFESPVIPLNSLKNARKGINESNEAIFKLMRATRERKDFRNELKKIKVPTLIVQGEKDMLFPPHLAEEVSKHIEGSQLTIIKHAGHTLNLERVNEVSGAIKAFLQNER